MKHTHTKFVLHLTHSVSDDTCSVHAVAVSFDDKNYRFYALKGA